MISVLLFLLVKQKSYGDNFEEVTPVPEDRKLVVVAKRVPSPSQSGIKMVSIHQLDS